MPRRSTLLLVATIALAGLLAAGVSASSVPTVPVLAVTSNATFSVRVCSGVEELANLSSICWATSAVLLASRTLTTNWPALF